MDSNGKKVTFLNANGTVTNANSKNMGHLDKDSKTYYYANGVMVFTTKDIDGETCDILDAQGKKLVIFMILTKALSVLCITWRIKWT